MEKQHLCIIFSDQPEEAWIISVTPLLTRVWSNLIDKALKFSPDHTHIIRHLYQENGMWVAL